MNRIQEAIFNQVVERVNRRNNVTFITGAGGNGKSFVLNKLYYHYLEQGYCVIKLAPTGVAAYNIEGETIHQFFGMNNAMQEINKLRLNDHVKLHKQSIFLIDEYSMVSKKLVEDISAAFVRVMHRNKLFGGVPFIFFGDVAQLLPINKAERYIWHSRIFIYSMKYSLKISMRQQGNLAFQKILEQIRNADFEDGEVLQFIYSRSRAKSQLPTNTVRLYVSNTLARNENEQELGNLLGEAILYKAIDYPRNNETARMTLKKESKLIENLYLKLGTRVMLTHNLDVENGWANGVLAEVQALDQENILLKHLGTGQTRWIQRIQDFIYSTVYTRKQFPIALSYASTIHKVQSLTIPSVAIFFSDMTCHGQLYVAMSRVKNPTDLYFFGITPPFNERGLQCKVNCDAVEIIRTLEQ
jgi:ATP-dependent exoDNAse (exonuclease V) alpha subunit